MTTSNQDWKECFDAYQESQRDLRREQERTANVRDSLAKEREMSADLLAALERLTRISAIELSGKRDDVLAQAHTAIAKAKGE